MGLIITVPKAGDGSEENPFRPSTMETHWQVVDERATEFDIEILD